MAAGKKYEDIRIAKSEWHGKTKQNAPFGQLPYLEIIEAGGEVFKLSQSMAMGNYFKKKTN